MMRDEVREEEDGSASPKSLLRWRGPAAAAAAAGICEGDGSSGLYRALAAAAGGYDNYMRMMQAAMGVGVAAAGAHPLPPRRAADDVVAVEPRGAGIKQQQQQSADDGEHAGAPPSNKLFTFLGFVVAPPPATACCSSRDHPFEMVGAGGGLANRIAATASRGEARLPCSLETMTPPAGKDAANPPSSSSVASAGDDDCYGCSLSLSLALEATRSTRSGDEGSLLLSPTTASSTGSRISLDLSLSTVDPSN